jgi:hypothetical protein
MAQQRKRATGRRGKSKARTELRKTSKPARRKAATRKRLAKLKPKRARPKKFARKNVGAIKGPSTTAVETGIVDVTEELVAGPTDVPPAAIGNWGAASGQRPCGDSPVALGSFWAAMAG